MLCSVAIQGYEDDEQKDLQLAFIVVDITAYCIHVIAICNLHILRLSKSEEATWKSHDMLNNWNAHGKSAWLCDVTLYDCISCRSQLRLLTED